MRLSMEIKKSRPASGAAVTRVQRTRERAVAHQRQHGGIFFAMPGERAHRGTPGDLPHPFFGMGGIRKSLIRGCPQGYAQAVWSPFAARFERFGGEDGLGFGCWPVAFGLIALSTTYEKVFELVLAAVGVSEDVIRLGT